MKTIRYIELFLALIMFALVAGIAFCDTYFQMPETPIMPVIDMDKQLWPLYLMYCFLLIVITWYEVNFLRILDILTLPGIIIALILAYIYDNSRFSSHIVGIFTASVPLYFAALAYLVKTGKDGVGGGVIKLAAMIGAFIGGINVAFSLIIAVLITVPYFYIGYKFRGQKVVEVGPLLSIVSLITIILPIEKTISDFIK